MISVPAPGGSAEALFDDAVSRKRGARKRVLEKAGRKISLCYKKISLISFKIAVPRRARQYSSVEKKALLHLYNVKTLPVKRAIQELYATSGEVTGEKCPYCGIGEPGTIDHYLPKEVFPQYAIIPMNLIPCCDSCNRIKGKHYKTANGLPVYLYVYDHSLFPSQFLKCEIIEKADGGWKAIFKFDFTGIPPDHASLIQRHGDRIRLFERLSKCCANNLAETRRIVDAFISEIGIRRTVGFVENETGQLAKQYGLNSWRHAMSQAVFLILKTRIPSATSNPLPVQTII